MDSAQKYSDTELSGLNQCELETRALIRTASTLNLIKENWEEKKSELPQALEKNRRLWTIIASAMREADCPQTDEIKKNIINLSLFIFKRTISVMADPNPRPDNLNILIDINMNIARGLSESTAAASPASS